MGRLDNKVVIVTGASSGIGRSCVMRLADEGARLVLVGRNIEALQSVIPEHKPLTYRCNLSDELEIRLFIESIKKDIGGIFGWVLAAGVHALRPLILESPKSLLEMWMINVMSHLFMLGMAQKARLIPNGGAVVLFSSVAATAGGGGQISYASTKGAVESVTRSLAAEWALYKIRVNAVVPGVVRTRMTEKSLGRLTSEQIARLEAMHPLGFGNPEDIAGPVAFLLSEDSRWMTGSLVVVDGGYSVV